MHKNKIMESLLNSCPDADWIKNQSKLPWLQLDIDVPTAEILAEWEKVKHRAVPHRSSDKFYNMQNVGWESLTLYGAASNVTTETDEEYDWTDIAQSCPVTRNWILDNFLVTETTGRIRFMLLRAGGYILPHKDRSESKLREINVAINNPTGCIFKFIKNGIIPFKDGTAYIIDTSNEHLVYNDSDTDRLHIILHADINNKIVEKSYEARYHNPRY